MCPIQLIKRTAPYSSPRWCRPILNSTGYSARHFCTLGKSAFPDLHMSGRGRGRASVLPAWMTNPDLAEERRPSDSNKKNASESRFDQCPNNTENCRSRSPSVMETSRSNSPYTSRDHTKSKNNKASARSNNYAHHKTRSVSSSSSFSSTERRRRKNFNSRENSLSLKRNRLNRTDIEVNNKTRGLRSYSKSDSPPRKQHRAIDRNPSPKQKSRHSRSRSNTSRPRQKQISLSPAGSNKAIVGNREEATIPPQSEPFKQNASLSTKVDSSRALASHSRSVSSSLKKQRRRQEHYKNRDRSTSRTRTKHHSSQSRSPFQKENKPYKRRSPSPLQRQYNNNNSQAIRNRLPSNHNGRGGYERSHSRSLKGHYRYDNRSSSNKYRQNNRRSRSRSIKNYRQQRRYSRSPIRGRTEYGNDSVSPRRGKGNRYSSPPLRDSSDRNTFDHAQYNRTSPRRDYPQQRSSRSPRKKKSKTLFDDGDYSPKRSKHTENESPQRKHFSPERTSSLHKRSEESITLRKSSFSKTASTRQSRDEKEERQISDKPNDDIMGRGTGVDHKVPYDTLRRETSARDDGLKTRSGGRREHESALEICNGYDDDGDLDHTRSPHHGRKRRGMSSSPTTKSPSKGYTKKHRRENLFNDEYFTLCSKVHSIKQMTSHSEKKNALKDFINNYIDDETFVYETADGSRHSSDAFAKMVLHTEYEVYVSFKITACKEKEDTYYCFESEWLPSESSGSFTLYVWKEKKLLRCYKFNDSTDICSPKRSVNFQTLRATKTWAIVYRYLRKKGLHVETLCQFYDLRKDGYHCLEVQKLGENYIGHD